MNNLIYFPTAKTAPVPKPDVFIVGKSYQARWVGDADLKTEYKVIHRTKSFVTLERDGKNIGKKKIFLSDCGAEYCKPEGDYSMCPILRCR